MKRKIQWINIIFLVLVVLVGCSKHEQEISNIEKPTFWVLSDTHLIAPTLYDDGEEFQRIKKTAAGKELEYQVESLTALVDQAIKEKPTGIIITGDLTLNGERESARKLSEILFPLKKEGIKYYVIPGNHDIHDGWAREFKDDRAMKTNQISPQNFEDIFSWSYENSRSKDKESLSYVVPVNEKLQFLMLDTNIYGKQQGTTVPQTKGRLKEETFYWIEKQLEIGKENNLETIVFMHHNLFQHNQLISEGFVIEESEKLKELLNTFQVPLVFSGHTHTQSIKQDDETNITEVVTASYSITEQTYGEVTFNQDRITYEKKSIDVDSWAKENGRKEQELLNYREFTKELFIDDSEKMAYVQLIESGIYDENILDPMAEFVGKANWHYFTGNQEKTDNLKESTGYQLIKQRSPFLLEYMDSIIETDNLNNTTIELKP